jgi:hypothetical protein
MRALPAILAALALTGCMGGNLGVGTAIDAAVPVKPADVADQTTLDERIGIVATLGYTAASRMGTALASAGLIDKARFKALDAQGYAAVLALKAAYDTGNAGSYSDAIARANAAVAGMKSLVR